MKAPTTKQAAIARELGRPGGPALSDLEIARRTDSSRALVRKVRAKLGATSAHRIVTRGGQRVVYKTPPGPGPAVSDEGPTLSSGSWPLSLELIFGPDQAGAQVEEALDDLLGSVHRLDSLLGRLSVLDRGKRFGLHRQFLISRLVNLIREGAREVLPVGPCPFCGVESKCSGCSRCEGSGWAPASVVDAFASMEERQARRRWWRKPAPEVVP